MSPTGQPPQREQHQGGTPRMRPTSPATLVVAGLASAALAWVVLAGSYDKIGALPWLPAFTVFALAIGEALLARSTKARIDRRPGTPPVDPLAVARYVVLAKASSLTGSIFTGFSAGVLIWLLVERSQTRAGSADVPAAAGSLVAAAALVAAALWLERACRVPERPEDDKPPE
jgi:hypothetical protein